jgi:hypothetical protein
MASTFVTSARYGLHYAPQIRDGRLERFLVPSGDRNARPLGQEKSCCGQANATIAASN